MFSTEQDVQIHSKDQRWNIKKKCSLILKRRLFSCPNTVMASYDDIPDLRNKSQQTFATNFGQVNYTGSSSSDSPATQHPASM